MGDMNILLWLLCALVDMLILNKMAKKGLLKDPFMDTLFYFMSIFLAPLMLVCLLALAFFDWQND